MLEDLTTPSRKITCKVKEIASQLSDKDSAIFIEAVNDKERWAIQTLSNELTRRGIQISPSPIKSHREKRCICFR